METDEFVVWFVAQIVKSSSGTSQWIFYDVIFNKLFELLSFVMFVGVAGDVLMEELRNYYSNEMIFRFAL